MIKCKACGEDIVIPNVSPPPLEPFEHRKGESAKDRDNRLLWWKYEKEPIMGRMIIHECKRGKR